ncbi:alpha/beta hydrolase [Kocuria sp. LHG3120]|uniref:alpha/beta hydrolase n=1 Tax=Kocuria sp. LHG3120 TaxID=2804590 RepID=UPI003CED5EA6
MSRSGALRDDDSTLPPEVAKNAALRVLLFLPALERSENQTATRIAQLLAQAASKNRPGTYLYESAPGADAATILSPNRRPLLKIIQVNYHHALKENPSQSKNSEFKDAIAGLSFALMGTLRLLHSLLRGQHFKSGRSTLQLFYAFALVIILWLSGLTLVFGAVLSITPNLLPEWLERDTTGGQITQTAGVLGVFVLIYWKIRAPVLQRGALLRAVMDYMEHHHTVLRATAVLDQAIDDVLESDPDAEIHIFGHSFGSIVALDTLFPTVSDIERRDLAAVHSLTTTGSSVDLLRTLYPDHFEVRERRCPDILWTNVFIPADVLASNFVNTGDDSATAAPNEKRFTIAGAIPSVNIAVGRPVIRIFRIPTMEGITIHGKYWDRNEPRHLERLVPTWLPTPKNS